MSSYPNREEQPRRGDIITTHGVSHERRASALTISPPAGGTTQFNYKKKHGTTGSNIKKKKCQKIHRSLCD
ncbi:MAG: hypothetical protein ABII90_09125 [Bacteroidota bacterium]